MLVVHPSILLDWIYIAVVRLGVLPSQWWCQADCHQKSGTLSVNLHG